MVRKTDAIALRVMVEGVVERMVDEVVEKIVERDHRDGGGGDSKIMWILTELYGKKWRGGGMDVNSKCQEYWQRIHKNSYCFFTKFVNFFPYIVYTKMLKFLWFLTNCKILFLLFHFKAGREFTISRFVIPRSTTELTSWCLLESIASV